MAVPLYLVEDNDDGVVAVGGSPDPETLKAAYSQGIFPWPHEGHPLLWFCPDPRFALVPEEAHLSRSLRCGRTPPSPR